MKIAVQDDGFATSGFRRKSVSFEDIMSISAEKLDKITYEELFLIVHSASGEGVALGELDEGFADLEKSLITRLDNFPTNWKVHAEEIPAGTRNEIWRATPG
jgi:hypothetical protein